MVLVFVSFPALLRMGYLLLVFGEPWARPWALWRPVQTVHSGSQRLEGVVHDACPAGCTAEIEDRILSIKLISLLQNASYQQLHHLLDDAGCSKVAPSKQSGQPLPSCSADAHGRGRLFISCR